MSHPVLIIGAGLSGLSAAIQLHQADKDYLVLEASDRAGGRVTTDIDSEGRQLDRGFQVFLTAYPDARRMLDYDKLKFKYFKPGAIILRADGKKVKIGDPFRDLSSAIPTIFSPIGSLSDKFKILKLKGHLSRHSVDEIFQQEQGTTLNRLKNHYGFSDDMIDNFFKPFFRGIFLEDNLDTDYRMFEYVFKMFGEGFAALPEKGMQAIPNQLLGRLDRDKVLFNKKVVAINGKSLSCADGTTYQASEIIVATEETGYLQEVKSASNGYRSTTNVYFESEHPLSIGSYIALNPDPNGIVNNICELTNVAPSYAKKGRLISVTLRDGKQEASIQQIKDELTKWYAEAQKWQHVKTYRISYALPNQDTVKNDSPVMQEKGIWIAGDHMLNGSINAAMKIGEHVGKKVVTLV